MCRIAASFGPVVRASSLIFDPPHGLEHQSRNAREMNGGSVAGDGWGIGWYPEDAADDAPPGMIKSILPLWADENAKTAAHAIASRSFVAHIRLASPGSEVCFTNTPLYPLGAYLFTINGEFEPWPGPVSRAIRARLDGEDEAAVRGSTDAEMLGALWRTCHRRLGAECSSDAIAAALAEALRIARDITAQHGGTMKANVVVGHAGGFVAARFAAEGRPASLYHADGQERWRGASLVASEPLDDGAGWRHVEPGSFVIADDRGHRCESIRIGSAGGSHAAR